MKLQSKRCVYVERTLVQGSAASANGSSKRLQGRKLVCHVEYAVETNVQNDKMHGRMIKCTSSPSKTPLSLPFLKEA